MTKPMRSFSTTLSFPNHVQICHRSKFQSLQAGHFFFLFLKLLLLLLFLFLKLFYLFIFVIFTLSCLCIITFALLKAEKGQRKSE